MKKYIPYIACFISGAILTLAFAPFYAWPIAIVAVMVLAHYQLAQPIKRAAFLGFIFGLGFFSTSVYWVFISIHVYGGTPIWLSGLLTLAFIAILAAFIAIQGVLLGCTNYKNNAYSLLLGFPCSFVLSEWLRSWVLTGFPWVLLGYSQTNSPLNGFAPILGVYGVSFLVCFLACLGLYAIKTPGMRLRCLGLGLLIFVSGALLHLIPWTHPTQKPLSVSLLQGNVPQSTKWSPEEVEENKTLYRAMTLPHLSQNIILWPESAITAPPWYAAKYVTQLAKEAKQQNSTILAGFPMNNPDEPDIYYNGVLALGEGHGMYLKRHLVPFGEYVPFEGWLRKLDGFFDLPMSNLTPGGKRQGLISAQGIQLATFICYEIAYGPLVYLNAAASNLLITVSDDTWFGHSFAPYQHLQIAQWRALETRRPLLFASNTGSTAIINAKGQITEQLPLFVQASLKGLVQPMIGTTPLLLYGQTPILFILGLLLFAPLLRKRFAKIRDSGILRRSSNV